MRRTSSQGMAILACLLLSTAPLSRAAGLSTMTGGLHFELNLSLPYFPTCYYDPYYGLSCFGRMSGSLTGTATGQVVGLDDSGDPYSLSCALCSVTATFTYWTSPSSPECIQPGLGEIGDVGGTDRLHIVGGIVQDRSGDAQAVLDLPFYFSPYPQSAALPENDAAQFGRMTSGESQIQFSPSGLTAHDVTGGLGQATMTTLGFYQFPTLFPDGIGPPDGWLWGGRTYEPYDSGFEYSCNYYPTSAWVHVAADDVHSG